MAFTFINYFDIEATQYMHTVSGQVQVFQLIVLYSAPAPYQNVPPLVKDLKWLHNNLWQEGKTYQTTNEIV